ncbi:MAG: cyanophycinase [Planctomycetota bacterium]
MGRSCWAVLLPVLSGLIFASATVADDPSGLALEVSGWPGTVAAVGGGEPPAQLLSLMRRAAGDSGTVAVLATASESPVEAASSAEAWLRSAGFSTVITDAAAADLPARTAFLEQLRTASAVWICGGQQSRLADAWQGTAIEAELRGILQRSGFVGGTSAGAAILSRVMIASGRDQPQLASGWDVIPGVIVDQHFSERSRQGRLEAAVRQHPALAGLGVDEGTAAVIEGRRLTVIGAAAVTVVLPPCSYRDDNVIRIPAGQSADLTQFRRAARQRSSDTDPGKTATTAVEAAAGSLVIVGGGAMPADVVKRFVELAGGSSGHVVVLPTAVPPEQTDRRLPGFLVQAGLRKVTVLDQRGRLTDSPQFSEAITDATGIWFGGGRQWHFVDAYEATQAVQLFKDVLARGGVIGGSSAGATIQGEFLVRGSPLGNTVMMAEGYERGFAFLPGTAIDQHFSQRGRQPELLPVIARHSGLLGIGLDEGTAIVVRGRRAEVAGLHSAHFVNSARLKDWKQEILPATAADAAALYVSVPAGGAIDLGTLQVEAPADK